MNRLMVRSTANICLFHQKDTTVFSVIRTDRLTKSNHNICPMQNKKTPRVLYFSRIKMRILIKIGQPTYSLCLVWGKTWIASSRTFSAVSQSALSACMWNNNTYKEVLNVRSSSAPLKYIQIIYLLWN